MNSYINANLSFFFSIFEYQFAVPYWELCHQHIFQAKYLTTRPEVRLGSINNKEREALASFKQRKSSLREANMPWESCITLLFVDK